MSGTDPTFYYPSATYDYPRSFEVATRTTSRFRYSLCAESRSERIFTALLRWVLPH